MWLDQFRQFWSQRLEALEVELLRHRRTERGAAPADLTDPPTHQSPHHKERP